MPELHLARCDAPGCTTEAPLIGGSGTLTSQAQQGYGFTVAAPIIAAYVLPMSWQRVEGRIFCSWACVAAYAEQRAKEQSA